MIRRNFISAIIGALFGAKTQTPKVGKISGPKVISRFQDVATHQDMATHFEFVYLPGCIVKVVSGNDHVWWKGEAVAIDAAGSAIPTTDTSIDSVGYVVDVSDQDHVHILLTDVCRL